MANISLSEALCLVCLASPHFLPVLSLYTQLGIFNLRFPLLSLSSGSWVGLLVRWKGWERLASLGGHNLCLSLLGPAWPSPLPVSVKLSLLCFWNKCPKAAVG